MLANFIFFAEIAIPDSVCDGGKDGWGGCSGARLCKSEVLCDAL